MLGCGSTLSFKGVFLYSATNVLYTSFSVENMVIWSWLSTQSSDAM